MMDFYLGNDYAPPLDAFLAFAASISQLSNDYPLKEHTESGISLPPNIFQTTFTFQNNTKPNYLFSSSSNEGNLDSGFLATAPKSLISPSVSVVTATPSMFSVNSSSINNHPPTTGSNNFNHADFNDSNNNFNEHGEVELPNLDPQRDSSEEKDLTPAQSRRKAQNRAAQRAFRERKEKHVKELENKLNTLESTTYNLRTDNERLKLAVQRATTENEILRATSGSAGTGTSSGSYGVGSSGDLEAGDSDYGSGNGSDSDMDSGRRQKTASGARARLNHADHDLYSTGSCIGGGQNNAPSSSSHQFSFTNSSSSTLLPSSAAWDFIQAHPLFKNGQLDIADVTARLRKVVRCDGHGPGFEKADIKKAIEQSRISSSDELI